MIVENEAGEAQVRVRLYGPATHVKSPGIYAGLHEGRDDTRQIP